ncbi:genetic competence negative regulator [Niallia sp. 03133]|uniref:genetic competence negative regulator n=1 Tax=Niallia sp. 03133 TaxID=3458060 RepID=UPI004043F6F4
MRLERLNYNRIKIHLTFDDLYERGLTKEDIWKDSIKWQYFFHEMLEEANDLFGLEINGSVAVEIFSLKAQGMVMILTMTEQEDDDEELLNEGFLEMQVTVEETVDILFAFKDLEAVIQVCKQLEHVGFKGGSLYAKERSYYLCFADIIAKREEQMVALLGEYGECCLTSIYLIQEYGKTICEQKAIETITTYFH